MDAFTTETGLDLMEETQEEKLEQQKKEKTDNAHPEFQKFLEELEKEAAPEKKVELALDFMSQSLAQSGTPNFRNFWDVRSLCLDLFKLEMPHPVRATFWNSYTDLTKEARRLKEILNEQSSFAVEQIELAINSIEEEVKEIEAKQGGADSSTLSYHGSALEESLPFYTSIQGSLHILNALAVRINSLRKELIKTEMRVRQKNKFFTRLSAAGDLVFPKRKELIKEVSNRFTADVKQFVERNFDKEGVNAPFYVLREEIKELQSFAKQLTLNTSSFSEMRAALSKCWDQIKELEKEKRKERSEKDLEYKENAEPLKEKIADFIETFPEKSTQVHEAYRKLDEISSEMRAISLAKDDVKQLKQRLNQARSMIHEVEAKQEEERAKARLEKEKERQEQLDGLKEEIKEALTTAPSLEIERIAKLREELLSKIQQSIFTKKEKMDLEKETAQLRELIAEKREEKLNNLPSDKKEALIQLKEVFEERIQLRNEVKKQLDEYRKESGSSNLDFEQAMKVNDLISQEKKRLDTINQGIEDLKSKIQEYEAGI